jgi:hypothetical protein
MSDECSLRTSAMFRKSLVVPGRTVACSGGTNKRGLGSQVPVSPPLAFNARPKSSFDAKMTGLLK